jgi:hypothetical protein
MSRKLLVIGGLGIGALLYAAASSAGEAPPGDGGRLIGAYTYPPLDAFTSSAEGLAWLKAVEDALGPDTGLVGLIVRVTEASADGRRVAGVLEQVDVYAPGPPKPGGKGLLRKPAPRSVSRTPMFAVASLGAPV